MAVNELSLPSVGITAEQTDLEILFSTVGLAKKGVTVVTGQDLASGTVLGRVTSSGKYAAYASPSETVSIAVDATGQTANGYTIGVAGITLAGYLVFDATAAAMQAKLETSDSIFPGDVVVTGGPGDSGGTTPYVVTWAGNYEGADAPTIVVTDDDLTGGGATVVATTTAGGEATGGLGTAIGVLHKAVDATSADQLGEIIIGGHLKYDQLTGLSTDAIADLNGVIDTVANRFSF